MAIKLFQDLNDEWTHTVRSRQTARSLALWQVTERSLREFDNLDTVVDRAHHPDRARRDDVMAALIRCGRNDRLAWRVVLHIEMPGLVCITNRFLPGPHSEDEVAATVVAAAWQRIAEYPLHRRPRNIGGNIGLDTRQIASGLLFRHAGREIPDPIAFHPTSPPADVDASTKLVTILGDAVRRRVVSLDDARLVALTRIHDVPVDRLAVERGVSPQSLRRRRLRAEAAIIADAA